MLFYLAVSVALIVMSAIRIFVVLQHWLWTSLNVPQSNIKKPLHRSPGRSCGTHMWTSAQGMLKIFIVDMRLKATYSRLQQHLSGAYESNIFAGCFLCINKPESILLYSMHRFDSQCRSVVLHLYHRAIVLTKYTSAHSMGPPNCALSPVTRLHKCHRQNKQLLMICGIYCTVSYKSSCFFPRHNRHWQQNASITRNANQTADMWDWLEDVF